MKPIHLQTQNETTSFIPPLCNKAAFLLIFAFLMQSITVTLSFRSVGYPGNEADYTALLAIKSQLLVPSNRVLSSWNDSIHHCSWEGVTCGRNNNRVTVLDLSSRGLAGTISPFIGNLSFLKVINLYNNNLYGEIPTQLGHLLRLHALRLYNNTLVGEIPANISRCLNLRVIDLGNNNKLSGVIPDGLRNCYELQDLYMEGNSFHGDIPSSFASLVNLQRIDFSRNNLSGPIPAFFSKFPNLYYLNLSYNDFVGRAPTNSVFANTSAFFVAGNNRLCGGIKQLQLPKCIENKSSGKKKKIMSSSALELLIIPVICALVGAISAGLYVAYNKMEKTPLLSGSMMGNVTMQVSYHMLLKATASFSSDNLLGMGSFGTVFKGILDGNTVAVKVLNLQHRSASKSFIAECKTLRNVRHRNIIGIITVCSSIDSQGNDFKALVYEFMPNGSLERWLHGINRNMSLPQRMDVAINVAHALIYLHHECETPIVHCNLKSSNILLDNDMVAHVGDFGLARFLKPRHPNQSSTIGIKGTIGYAAPEYGLVSDLSTERDVYSYGILLLELMTGKSPTDSMFKEGYSLHKHAEAALSDQVLQIVDPSLEDNLTEEADDTREIQDELQRRVECIASVITVGLSCSNHLPQERMKIVDATIRLQSARDNLVNARNRRNLRARGIS